VWWKVSVGQRERKRERGGWLAYRVFRGVWSVGVDVLLKAVATLTSLGRFDGLDRLCHADRVGAKERVADGHVRVFVRWDPNNVRVHSYRREVSNRRKVSNRREVSNSVTVILGNGTYTPTTQRAQRAQRGGARHRTCLP
jgi:hypothetical protein